MPRLIGFELSDASLVCVEVNELHVIEILYLVKYMYIYIIYYMTILYIV